MYLKKTKANQGLIIFGALVGALLSLYGIIKYQWTVSMCKLLTNGSLAHRIFTENCSALKVSAIGGALMIAIFVPSMLLIPCSNPSIVGVNIHKEFKEEISHGNNVLDENFLSIDQPCNEQCDCSTKSFDPICNKASGLSYVSPCYAGCQLYQTNENPQCSCIEGDIELENGFCDPDCPIWRYWVFVLLFFIAIACGEGTFSKYKRNFKMTQYACDRDRPQ